MGALNHGQNLFKSRPWELKRTIFFDIFSIEMSRLKIDLRNTEIIKVTPLMVDGYRFWLHNISRYSYNFFNFKSTNTIYIKTFNVNFIKLNWIKLINLIGFLCYKSMSNSNNIIVKFTGNRYLLKTQKTKDFSCFFNIFLADSTDLLSIKNLLIFTKTIFGYDNFSFSKKIPINFLNNPKNLYFEKTKNRNYINLDLNMFKVINFQMDNINNITHLQEILKYNVFDNFFNYLSLFLYYNLTVKFLIKNLKIQTNCINKTKNYSYILKFFNSKLISQKKKKTNFIINFDNISRFNLDNLTHLKNGKSFLNTNTDYNLNFVGYFGRFKNIQLNFIKKEFLFLYDITSYINWLSVEKLKNIEKKLLNLNYNLILENIRGINIPANSIVNIRHFYINSFGNIIKNENIIKINKNKSIFNVLQVFLKNIKI